MINEKDLRHISQVLDTIERLESCHQKYTLEEACNDYMIFDVILMEFENLGNYMMKLSNELIKSHPDYTLMI